MSGSYYCLHYCLKVRTLQMQRKWQSSLNPSRRSIHSWASRARYTNWCREGSGSLRSSGAVPRGIIMSWWWIYSVLVWRIYLISVHESSALKQCFFLPTKWLVIVYIYIYHHSLLALACASAGDSHEVIFGGKLVVELFNYAISRCQFWMICLSCWNLRSRSIFFSLLAPLLVD